MKLALGLATLLLPAFAAPARAEGAPPASPQAVFQPVMQPDKIFALNKAKKTLLAAHALLEKSAGSERRATIGFNSDGKALPPLRFRNESAVLMQQKDGTDHIVAHAGYKLEVSAADGDEKSWTPVLVGRHGAIASRLFTGSDSVFAKSSNVQPETLAAASRADFASAHPVDKASVWMARSQNRALTSTRAHVYVRVPAPATSQR